jgi:PKD repeat protein
VTGSHTYGHSGVYTVTLNVTDDVGGWNTDTLTATIDNVPPTVEAGPNLKGDEGTPINFKGSFTDPSWLDTHNATWTWGDPSPVELGTLVEEHVAPDSTGNVTGTHTYGHAGLYTVTLMVTDDAGGSAIDTLTVTVDNVPPKVGVIDGKYSVYYWITRICNDANVTFKVGFTDPSWLDTHTATINFGDGSPTEPATVTEEHVPPDSTGNVTAYHLYGGPLKTFIVTVTVTDDAGGVGTLQFQLPLTPVGGEVTPTVISTYLWPLLMAATAVAAVLWVKRYRTHISVWKW